MMRLKMTVNRDGGTINMEGTVGATYECSVDNGSAKANLRTLMDNAIKNEKGDKTMNKKENRRVNLELYISALEQEVWKLRDTVSLLKAELYNYRHPLELDMTLINMVNRHHDEELRKYKKAKAARKAAIHRNR